MLKDLTHDGSRSFAEQINGLVSYDNGLRHERVTHKVKRLQISQKFMYEIF